MSAVGKDVDGTDLQIGDTVEIVDVGFLFTDGRTVPGWDYRGKTGTIVEPEPGFHPANVHVFIEGMTTEEGDLLAPASVRKVAP